MKHIKWVLAVAMLGITMTACVPGNLQSKPENTGKGHLPGTTITTVTTVGATASTNDNGMKPTFMGWKQEGGIWYYYDTDGHMMTGFVQIGAATYYFDTNGAMQTGWVDILNDRYYFSVGGIMQSGWLTLDGNRYYLNADGTMRTGWLTLDGNRYYLNADGTMRTGWMELDGNTYYFKTNGVMAKGMLEIDGEKNYFTSSGAQIMLVNAWNSLNEGYAPQITVLTRYADPNKTVQVDATCYDDLLEMLRDCEAQSQKAVVVSGYRTLAYQQKLFENRIIRFQNEGYSREEAERLAAQVVAPPGTSEHHLGLAVDIVDNRNWSLDETQAQTPAQKWLMANSWKYGFILRYPVGKTEVTGIIYEPWHYRYVGKELAKELYELGLTLEEYLDQLTQEANG